MFRRIQNESLTKECIRVRIRGAFLAKKGAPKLNFHREGGAVAPICPPKSATDLVSIMPPKIFTLFSVLNLLHFNNVKNFQSYFNSVSFLILSSFL